MGTIIRKCEECGSEFVQDLYTADYDVDGPEGKETHAAQSWKLCKICSSNIPDPMADTFKFLGLK